MRYGGARRAIESRRRDPGRSRARLRGALIAVVLGGVAVAAAVVAALLLTGEEAQPPALALPSEIVGPDSLTFDDSKSSEYERAAAFGLSHALFAKSPGGVAASARRTATVRSMIEDAAEGSGFDADMLEAIVFLESAGRPDVIAGDDVEHAAGLMQILAETATNFLDMKVDLAASRRLTPRIEDARRRGNEQEAERLRAERRRVDARFDPGQALAGAVRYLTEARRRFGRDDLAIVSYHMGIGNLENVLRAYSGRAEDPIQTVVEEGDLDYARIYFDSSPARRREAWELLASLGDDSQTYYWRVLAAREIMRLYRESPAKLERLAELQRRGPSAELVLQPPEATPRLTEPSHIERAFERRVLRPLPNDPSRTHFDVDARLDRVVARAGGDPAAYRTLRGTASRLLSYLATRVYNLSGAERPLTVTRAVYDEASARLFASPDPDRAAHSSLHATGFSFDVRRRYESGAQAAAFQWTLERLETLGLIAWWRGRAVIHITVSPRADLRLSPSDRS